MATEIILVRPGALEHLGEYNRAMRTAHRLFTGIRSERSFFHGQCVIERGNTDSGSPKGAPGRSPAAALATRTLRLRMGRFRGGRSWRSDLLQSHALVMSHGKW